MQGFNDRRPVTAVPPIELRSRQALEDHMASHHGVTPGAYGSHSEVREHHQDIHGDQFAIVHVPHAHSSARFVNPPGD